MNTMQTGSIPQRREHMRSYLSHLGVACVGAGYDGGGDIGQIEHICLWDGLGEPMVMAVDGEMANALQWLLYDLVRTRQKGWDVEPGTYGHLTWEIVQDHLHHTCSEDDEALGYLVEEGWE